jgi:PAS domain S-box-containing protein
MGDSQVTPGSEDPRPYQLIVATMNEGAAVISPTGVILIANPRLGAMIGEPAGDLIGRPVRELIAGPCRPAFAGLIDAGAAGSASGVVDLTARDGMTVPVQLAVSGLDLDGAILRCLVLTDLTAQVAAESRAARAHEVLREQRAFLEQAQESAGLGWWSYRPDRADMLTWSPEAHRIFGIVPAEFDGKAETLAGLVHPDDRPWVDRVIAAALAGGPPYRAEHRIIRPDGAVRWVMQAAVVEHDDFGAVSRMLGICQDITDRKGIEDDFRASAAYNRSLIEASLTPMFTIGADGTINDVNEATEELTGRRRAELLGTPFSGYFTEPDQAQAGCQQAFRDGSARDYPLELRHRAGHITSMLFNAAIYRDPSGRVLGVMAAARDVTETKAAEAALRESEERLRAVFDDAPVGIVERSLSGEVVRANARFCQITGYSEDELRSLPIADISHPGDLDADLDGLRRLTSGAASRYSMWKRFVRKDGEVVFTELNRAMVRDPDGGPLVSVGIVRDITAQRAAEAEVRALNTRLEERVAQRTADLARSNTNLQAFTYSVSHDLRTPLRALSGFSEALLEDYGDRVDETGRMYARRIREAAEQMGRIIDDLLQLAEVSRADLSLESVDLSAEVTAIAGDLQSREPGRRVRFGIEASVWVIADRTLIRALVRELIENAWKFTARRDGASIEFATAAADGAGVCCYVRDNGIGFDPAYGHKLFQPFQRLHASEDYPGTGIGLASVRRIAERHGQRAWAEGTIDGGAAFYFTLDAATRT